MSQSDEFDQPVPPPSRSGGSRRAEKPRLSGKRRGPVGLVVLLLVLALAAGGLYWGGKKGVEFVEGLVSGPADFDGPGSGEVTFEVKQGDTAAAMGRGLKAAGVVASVESFIDAANANPASSGIQVGFYALKEEMAAADVVTLLADPENRVQNTVTIPEGLRTADILDVLAKKTEFSRKQYAKALKDPELGLPAYAEGNPEGYLFPATYEIGPKDQPVDVLAKMVARWRQAAEAADLEGRAQALGTTPHDLMTIASLVQAEGRGDDMPKVSRVVWNRLEGPGDKGGTNGLLQIDAAVNYALDRTGTIRLTNAEIESVASSPYNTYRQVGLPPTPINSPGDAAIEAASHPADGPWYYYVTVDLKTGETKFTDSYQEFLEFKAEYNRYCEKSDAC